MSNLEKILSLWGEKKVYPEPNVKYDSEGIPMFRPWWVKDTSVYIYPPLTICNHAIQYRNTVPAYAIKCVHWIQRSCWKIAKEGMHYSVLPWTSIPYRWDSHATGKQYFYDPPLVGGDFNGRAICALIAHYVKWGWDSLLDLAIRLGRAFLEEPIWYGCVARRIKNEKGEVFDLELPVAWTNPKMKPFATLILNEMLYGLLGLLALCEVANDYAIEVRAEELVDNVGSILYKFKRGSTWYYDITYYNRAPPSYITTVKKQIKIIAEITGNSDFIRASRWFT